MMGMAKSWKTSLATTNSDEAQKLAHECKKLLNSKVEFLPFSQKIRPEHKAYMRQILGTINALNKAMIKKEIADLEREKS